MATVPAIGAKLGRYRLEELVGRGAMGAVYRAEDLRLGRRVALKVLAAELADDARFRERFLAESRLAASLDHAGIVPIFEAGEADGLLYIAMRYVEGGDLRELLRRAGRLAPERAIALVEQVADALDVAHARGLVHRDVEPSNVLVAMESGREHAYLADFGLTKHTTARGGPTANDQMVGTVDYVAPEQIRGDEVDGRADIYSLGCLLYECLTGDVPFPRGSEVATIYAHLEDEPPPVSARCPEVPPAMDAVVARAMAKDPADRWQTGAELAAAFRGALDTADAAAGHWRPPRRVLVGLALAVAMLAGLGALLIARSGGHAAHAVADADAVAVIDPNRTSLVRDIQVGSGPSQVVAGAGALWVANTNAGTVSRIDPRTRTVNQTVLVGSGPSDVAVGARGVWVVNNLDGTLSWISPATDQVVATKSVGNGPSGVCVAAGAVWIASSYDSNVVRFDPATGGKTTIHVDDEPTRLACGGGSVWAASEGSGTVTQVDPHGRGKVVRRIPVGNGPSGLAWGSGALWVANRLDGTVSRIDGRRGVQSAVIPVGARTGPADVAVGAGRVWVSNELAGTVDPIDPANDEIGKPLKIGNRPQGLAVVDGSLWVGVRAVGAQHRGGTLRVLQPAVGAGGPWSPAGFDPASGYGPWGILQLTNDGLVAFRRVGGIHGATVVPDLAASPPAVTDGGRTYSFRLRQGIRYSTGAPVHASDIRLGIERVVRARNMPPFYAAIRGARRCVALPSHCDLSSGIEVDDAAGTITFHLDQPDPDFLDKLALPAAVAVPRGTGKTVHRVLPATGPYMIAKLGPPPRLLLVRNPHFRPIDGRPVGYPDAIQMDLGAGAKGAIRTIEQGRADVIGGTFGLPASVRSSLDAIATRYAGQLHTTLRPSTVYAFLNTRRAPFDNVYARRALNFAVDRGAFVALKGGPRFAQATCQILPPDFHGYQPYCPYTAHAGPGRPWSAPDLSRARRLVARSHTRGARVTVIGEADFLNGEAHELTRVLNQLGYHAKLRFLSTDVDYFGYIADSRHRVQTGLFEWAADYPGASGYLQPLFGCDAFVPADPSQVNDSEFCDARTDQLMQQARRQKSVAAADALWSKVDQRIVDQAAALPLDTPKALAFTSRRVGDYQYSPQWGVLYDQLWVR
ncbi:MAG TPA: ABC transporter substrate-binding protein [Solirubrobacteraceae bacterium]